MKPLFLLYLFLLTSIYSFAQLPGSGRNLQFDNSEADFIESSTSNLFNTTGSFTIEGWYFWNNNPATNTNFCFEIGDGSTGYKYMWNNRTNLFGGTNGMTLGFRAADGSYNDFVFNYTPPQNKWVHLAYTWNSTINEISFLANGFLIGSRISTKIPASAGALAKLYIAKQFINVAPTFDGEIDEFRMFNINLPQNTFYNRMCKKIATTDALYNNLICYYDFDLSASTTIPDRSANGINLSGSGTSLPQSQISSAPVGNICGATFSGANAGYILTNTTRGDRIIAQLTSGNAEGIAVYAVTEFPNNNTGQIPLPGNNGYFGVFPLNGTNATYSVQYDYVGVSLGTANDNQLQLYKRTGGNNTGTWKKIPTYIDSATLNLYNYEIGENNEVMIGLYNPVNSKKPGSGNAVQFNNSAIAINNIPATSKPTKQLTAMAWVNITSNNALGGIVSNAQDNGSDEAGFYLFTTTGTNNIEFGVKTVNNTFGSVMPTAQVPLNKWIHIAGTYDGANIRLYVNGILKSVIAATGDVDWVATNPTKFTIGSYIDDDENNPFNGKIDEVSVWSKALNINEIRDRMCKKITTSDPLNPYMVSYFNFDENLNGTIAYDGTIYENNGTYSGTVVSFVSGAPIGNDSRHDYIGVGTGGVKQAGISNPLSVQENFFAIETSGLPEGIHSYFVEEKPNSETGILGVGQNNRYFGVYQVGGTTPTYSALYYYQGNTFVNATNQNSLALFSRSNNSITGWVNTNGILNTSTKIISTPGQSTEYMLGNTLIPLPLKEIKLQGYATTNKDMLQWSTIGETNVLQHTLQHSIDGLNFTILSSFASKGNGNNTYFHNTIKIANFNFYRVITTDINGQIQYSNIIKIEKNKLLNLAVLPNPANNYINIKGLSNQSSYTISNSIGQKVATGITLPNQSIIVSQLLRGVYSIKVATQSLQFIIQ